MTLSAEEVGAKTFTPVRLREGYEMAEVDDFLDQVEATITTLTESLTAANQAKADLAAQVADLTAGLQDASGTAAQVADAELAAAAAAAEWETERSHLTAQVADLTARLEAEQAGSAELAAAAADRRLPALDVSPDQVRAASQSAARLLEIATRNAEELLDLAKADAEQRIDAARVQSDTLLAAAAQAAEEQAAELARAREEALSRLGHEIEQLSGQVATLRSFEDEYRARLRHDLTGFLQVLGASAVTDNHPPLDPDETEDPSADSPAVEQPGDGEAAGDHGEQGQRED